MSVRHVGISTRQTKMWQPAVSVKKKKETYVLKTAYWCSNQVIATNVLAPVKTLNRNHYWNTNKWKWWSILQLGRRGADFSFASWVAYLIFSLGSADLFDTVHKLPTLQWVAVSVRPLLFSSVVYPWWHNRKKQHLVTHESRFMNNFSLHF